MRAARSAAGAAPSTRRCRIEPSPRGATAPGPRCRMATSSPVEDRWTSASTPVGGRTAFDRVGSTDGLTDEPADAALGVPASRAVPDARPAAGEAIEGAPMTAARSSARASTPGPAATVDERTRGAATRPVDAERFSAPLPAGALRPGAGRLAAALDDSGKAPDDSSRRDVDATGASIHRRSRAVVADGRTTEVSGAVTVPPSRSCDPTADGGDAGTDIQAEAATDAGVEASTDARVEVRVEVGVEVGADAAVRATAASGVGVALGAPAPRPGRPVDRR